MTLKRLMTTSEVAEYLAVPVSTIHRWRYVGTGPPAIRVGRHLRFDTDDLSAWSAGRETTVTNVACSVNGWTVEGDAIPLTRLDGKGGALRDQWLDTVTAEGVAPRRGAVRKMAYAVAYHANGTTFKVFPSVAKLARRLALGENSVRAGFKWLVANGWLILIEEGGGRHRPNTYLPSIPATHLEDGEVE